MLTHIYFGTSTQNFENQEINRIAQSLPAGIHTVTVEDQPYMLTNIEPVELLELQNFLIYCNYHTESLAVQAFEYYIEYSNEKYLHIIKALEQIKDEHTKQGHLTAILSVQRHGLYLAMNEEKSNETTKKETKSINIAPFFVIELYENWIKEGKPSHWRTGLKLF